MRRALCLAACLIAGSAQAQTYQYKDNTGKTFNVQLFGCTATASCTSMTIQDSSGNVVGTIANPFIVATSGSSITIGSVPTGAYANGAIVAEGSTADGAITAVNQNGSIISILKGIFNNVITPINVTGSFAVSSPLGVNIASTTPINVTMASPLNVTSTFSVASPQGVAVVNSPTVVLSGSPVSVGISASPVGVGVVNSPTVVLSGSPVSVGLSQTPLNVTVGNSPTVAVSTSPIAVNIASSPVNVTLAPSPINVTVGSPQNVSLVALPGTPISVIQTQTPQNVTLVASPLNVTLAGPTPLNMTLVAIPGTPISILQSQTPQNVVYAGPTPTVTSAYNVTGSALGIGPTPGILGLHSLAYASCATRAPIATPTSFYLQVLDSGTTAVSVGSTLPVAFIAMAGSPLAVGFLAPGVPPGLKLNNGLTVALTLGPLKSSTAVGATVDCTFAYN